MGLLSLAAAVAMCLAATPAQAKWEDLFKFPWTDVPFEIALTLSCPTASGCYVAGSKGHAFGIYKTTNTNFTSLVPAKFEGGHRPLLIAAISMYPGSTKGLACGTGALKDSGVFYTKDGINWKPSLDLNLLTCFNAATLSEREFAFMGDPNDLSNLPGIGISKDGGYLWKGHQWNIQKLNMPFDVQATGGAFLTTEEYYIVGGTNPNENHTNANSNFLRLGSRTTYDKINKRFYVADVVPQPKVVEAVEGGDALGPGLFPQPQPAAPPRVGYYYACVTKTTDGGNTWTKTWDLHGEYTLADVVCVNSTYCVATGWSYALESSSPGARILVSADSGKTWVTKLLVNNYPAQSFISIKRPGPNDMWVGGAVVKSGLKNHAVFYHSADQGQTWTLKGEVSGIEDLFDMSFSSPTLGYAAALTETHVTTFIKFSA